MKTAVLGLSFLFLIFQCATAEPRCAIINAWTDKPAIENWRTIKQSCLEKMKSQISTEISASLKYLSMAGHFAKDEVNRPGFAKMFFEAASEERQHAMKLIEYLSMRGEYSEEIQDFRVLPAKWAPPKVDSGESSLLMALKMETEVTDSIVKVIKDCENTENCQECNDTGACHNKCLLKLENDYHLVDYLTGEFLDEQYKGQKEIANRLSTLNKMSLAHKEMGEFLFDKKLLMGV